MSVLFKGTCATLRFYWLVFNRTLSIYVTEQVIESVSQIKLVKNLPSIICVAQSLAN